MRATWIELVAYMLAGTSAAFGQTNVFPSSGDVGIGTAAPQSLLNVNNTGTSVAVPFGHVTPAYVIDQANGFPLTSVEFSGNTSSAVGHAFFQYSARGTAASPSAVQQGDSIGGLRTSGFGATTWGSRRANLLFWAAENWTDATQGTYLTLETTPIGTAAPSERMRIDPAGNVGIGTANPQYPLSVNGTVQAKEVLVNTGWSDYVFAPSYRLPGLKDTAAFIRKNGHLPNIPSEAEIKEKGVPVGEMESKLLAKVEELTLHMIQADERNDRLEQRNDRLAQQNRDLQDRLARLEMRIGH